MKNLAIISALLFGIGLSAQTIFIGPHNRDAEILDMLLIEVGEYVIASKSSYNEGTTIEWFKQDTLYKKHRISNDVAVLHFRKNETNISVEAYTFFECDVVIPGNLTYLLDTVSVEEIYIPASNSLPEFANAKQLDDGTLIVIEGDAQSKISTGLKVFIGGNQIAEFGVPNEKLTELAEIDDNVFIYGQDYAFYLNKSTLTFDTLNYEGFTVHKIVKTDEKNKIAVLSDFSVDVINLVSGEIISYPFAVGDGGHKDIIYTDQLYFLRSREDNNNQIQVINDEGQWETEYYDLFYGANYTEMYEMSDGEIWLAGRYSYLSRAFTTNLTYGTYIVQKLGNLVDTENDLAIEYLSAEGNGESHIELTVKVTNKSAESLENIRIYSTSLGGIWCISWYFDYTIEVIQPGEELIISQSVYLINNKYDGEVCFYTLGSGRNPDLDIEDNFTCGMVTNTNETLNPLRAASIYPNPANDKIYIDNFTNGDRITIGYLSGRIVMVEAYSNGIEIGNLPSGLYILENMETKEFGKFFKQ